VGRTGVLDTYPYHITPTNSYWIRTVYYRTVLAIYYYTDLIIKEPQIDKVYSSQIERARALRGETGFRGPVNSFVNFMSNKARVRDV
jgi:hypothetical protein